MEKYKFSLPIGDWSGDGHSQHKDYILESNKSVQEVREIYFQASEKLGFTLDGHHELTPCSEYGDESFPVETLDKLIEFGLILPKETIDYIKNNKRIEGSKMFANILIAFLKAQDASLEIEIVPEEKMPMFQFYGYDEKNRHIGYFGYGLFNDY